MWYLLKDPGTVISPSLIFYKDRIENNIDQMIAIAGDPDRLIPHVKTHKCIEVVKIQLDKGISKFKCATISEAEMIAEAGGKWILLAYQMVGPNIQRILHLKKTYADVHFSSLIDNESSAEELQKESLLNDVVSSVFIDVNNGMDRTGHPANSALLSLYTKLRSLANINVTGVHVYDGHIRDRAFEDRKGVSDHAFFQLNPLLDLINEESGKDVMIVAGGSPTFTIHTLRPDVYLSPGTNVLWDWGYDAGLQEQTFLHAALILTRVISRPAEGIITIDLGHKAVAAENPIDRRFRLLGLDDYKLLGQSEEHGVLEVDAKTWQNIQTGDIYYALPYHICPTVALHDFATVVVNGEVLDEWKIVSRNRRINI
jgi:D-serine deaminase-like pyridoxal phosphate-dependent protein